MQTSIWQIVDFHHQVGSQHSRDRLVAGRAQTVDSEQTGAAARRSLDPGTLACRVDGWQADPLEGIYSEQGGRSPAIQSKPAQPQGEALTLGRWRVGSTIGGGCAGIFG